MKYLNPTTLQYETLSIKALDGMPIGLIMLWPGTASTIPTGWLLCDGTSLSEEEYPELFDVIGHIYGGSGTSFNLPDYRDRTPVGYDANDNIFNQLGKKYGSKWLQQHNHSVADAGNIYTPDTGNGHWLVLPGVSTGYPVGTANTGDGDAGNIQPSLVQNFIIKATNTTPTMASVVNAKSNSTEDTYSCKYINDGEKYSTSEVKTNKTWIDGKPIYRKVITMQNQAVAQVSVGTISNMDSVISLNGLLLSSTVKNIIGSHNDDNNYVSRLYMYGNSIYYQQGSGWQSTSYDIQVIVEYTKTTD